MQSSIDCVVTAIHMVELLHSEKAVHGSELKFGCPWWYNILFLYKSAVVLIAARLSLAVIADISEDSISNAWAHVVELINNYGFYSKAARHLLTTLLTLADAVPYQYSKPSQGLQMEQSLIAEPLQRVGGGQNEQRQKADSAMEKGSMTTAGNFDNFDQRNLWTHASSHDTEGLDNFIPTTLDFNIAFDPNDLNWLNLVFDQ